MFDMSHLHPMIIHFPIALLMVGFLADLSGIIYKKEFFIKAGLYLLILGTIGVIAAYFSGHLAGEGVEEAGTLKQALENHENAAELSLWLMVAAAIVRIIIVALKKYSGSLKYAALMLFLLGVLSIIRTGYYGGELVYKHAAGVQFNLGMDINNAPIQISENSSGKNQDKE
jgi:uncharacterized membrane protein